MSTADADHETGQPKTAPHDDPAVVYQTPPRVVGLLAIGSWTALMSLILSSPLVIGLDRSYEPLGIASDDWIALLRTVCVVPLAVWIGLAAGRTRDRLLWGAALLLTLCAAITASFLTWWPGWWDVWSRPGLLMSLQSLGVFVALATIAFYYRQTYGWRLAPSNWPHPIPPGKPWQFSLRQMLIGTALLGGTLVMGESWITVSRLLITFLAIGFCACLVIVPLMTLTLGSIKAGTARWLDAAVLTLMLGLVAGFYAWNWQDTNPMMMAVFALYEAGFLWLRAWGLRLVKGTAQPAVTAFSP